MQLTALRAAADGETWPDKLIDAIFRNREAGRPGVGAALQAGEQSWNVVLAQQPGRLGDHLVEPGSKIFCGSGLKRIS